MVKRKKEQFELNKIDNKKGGLSSGYTLLYKYRYFLECIYFYFYNKVLF